MLEFPFSLTAILTHCGVNQERSVLSKFMFSYVGISVKSCTSVFGRVILVSKIEGELSV